MTYAAMNAIPVTDLRTRQPEIFAQLTDAPVLLTRQGHGAGVLCIRTCGTSSSQM